MCMWIVDVARHCRTFQIKALRVAYTTAVAHGIVTRTTTHLFDDDNDELCAIISTRIAMQKGRTGIAHGWLFSLAQFACH